VRRAEALLGAPMPALGPMLRRWRDEETDGTLDRLRSLVARPVDTNLDQEGAR
jgi:hypothetical protein